MLYLDPSGSRVEEVGLTLWLEGAAQAAASNFFCVTKAGLGPWTLGCIACI